MAVRITESLVLIREWPMRFAQEYVVRDFGGRLHKRSSGFTVYDVRGGGQAKVVDMGAGRARVEFYKGKCAC